MSTTDEVGTTPASDSPYWDPIVETMDPADREKLILGKLKRQLLYCYEKSAFYRERWDAAGADPRRLTSVGDLRRFPLIRKVDVRAEQAAHPPSGGICAWPERTWRGSTGRRGPPGVRRPSD